jgi:magnesium chelatase accessory protein
MGHPDGSHQLQWQRDGAGWPHRQASRFVAAGGCHWHVQVLGPSGAPPLWLLHGTGASSHSWRDLVPLLVDDFRLVVPDLPGHGFSTRLPARQATMSGMAAALGALATALVLPPATVVGHSAGAALAVRAVIDGGIAPARVVGLNAALLPFGGLAGVVFAPLARLMANQSVVPWLVSRSARDLTAVKRLVAATGSSLDADGLAWYALLMRSPAHVAGALAMMADWDLASLWRDLPGLVPPLALVVGQRDGTVPPGQAQRVKTRLPGTAVVELPGLGHLAHEEAPARVAALLRDRGLLPARAASAPGL